MHMYYAVFSIRTGTGERGGEGGRGGETENKREGTKPKYLFL